MITAPLRPLRESDIGEARALLRDAIPVASQLAILQATVEAAALSPGTEQRGIVADADGRLTALAIYGEYAGAAGAGRLQLVAVGGGHRRRGLGTLIVQSIAAELRAHGARFLLAELSEERPALDGYVAFLHAQGFIEESRVPDFHGDGVALVFLRKATVPHETEA
jgi:ribosomal-protein-alanine N-acetyltransferase